MDKNQKVAPEGTAKTGNNSGIKTFIMERTSDAIKSKFLSVLGNSTDLINGISNKIDAALSMSSSSEPTETTANQNEARVQKRLDEKREFARQRTKEFVPQDFDAVDFDYRKVKERRAMEEVKAGRYKQPTFVSRLALEDFAMYEGSATGSMDNTDDSNVIESPSSRSTDVIDFDLAGTDDPQLNVEPVELNNQDSESVDIKNFIPSESMSSVPSWASSISLDSAGEELALEFMRNFIKVLFTECSLINIHLKAEFGEYAKSDYGRLWFVRLLTVQRVKSKKVDEITFFALIQYFAIVLFECMESDDFAPAKNLMNLCFTFYYEVQVPGCEPYPEYLYTFLKDQPIWHSLRFWNAAFFDALQNQRANKPIPNTESLGAKEVDTDEPSHASSTSSRVVELEEDKQFQQNITFGQLGTFTCNMHAFGLGRDLTNEFLRKQCTIADLTAEQQQLLQDNVNRMYRETDPWRV